MAGEKSMGRTAREIFLWRGLLGEASRSIRIMTFVLICLMIVALAFTQLGFVLIRLPENTFAFVITLTVPVVIGSLLFGVLRGTLIGLIDGLVLAFHSVIMPLEYYEQATTTPIMMIVAFTSVGLLSSLLLAIVLKISRSSRTKRFIGYALVSLVASGTLTTLLFFDRFATSMRILASDASFFDITMKSMDVTTGSIPFQIIIDFLLAFAFCIAVDFIYERYAINATNHRIATLFRGWLLAVTFGVFMVASVIEFCTETASELNQADKKVDSQLEYLIAQIEDREERKATAESLFATYGSAGAGSNNDSGSLFSVGNILDGYDVHLDGIIIIFKDGVAVDTNGNEDILGLEADLLLHSYEGSLIDKLIEGDGLQQLVVSGLQTAEPQDIGAVSFKTFMTTYGNGASTGDYQIFIEMPSDLVFANRTSTMLWTTFMTIVLLAAVFVLASMLLKRLVVRRIDENNEVLVRIAAGDLDEHLVGHDTYEFASFAHGVNSMVDSLKESMEEIATRMDRELATAKAIQESSLPSALAPLPGVGTIAHFSLMHPAREVGGDFYDFFPVDSGRDDGSGSEGSRVAFVIADVSGKGIPAALFMMTAKAQVQNYIATGMSLEDAIDSANHQLCHGNDAGMFVTLFACVLDCETGRLECVNAGHNPPLLFHGDSWEWMREVGGLPLGLFEEMPYSKYEVFLEPGDRLFLYTDGVTEAMSAENELFGEDRLMRLIEGLGNSGPRELIECVLGGLTAHAAGADQSDDITMLSFEYGSEEQVSESITVQAETSELPTVLEFVHEGLEMRLCPIKAMKQLDIAIEELFVNVCRYAYAELPEGEPRDARITCSYDAEAPSVTVEIADRGVPFDPLAKPDAVTPKDIMDVPIGGLGILMAKKSVDEIAYKRVDGENRVSITKRW